MYGTKYVLSYISCNSRDHNSSIHFNLYIFFLKFLIFLIYRESG